MSLNFRLHRLSSVTTTMEVVRNMVMGVKVPTAVHSDGTECTKEYAALNDELKGQPVALPVAVLADEQTVGRGTGGRPWTSPAGNMYMTVAIPPPRIEVLPILPLIVGLAVRDATLKVVKGKPLHIPEGSDNVKPTASWTDAVKAKWPNDVLIGGRKLAGALIEAADDEKGTIIIGIGVNVATAPTLSDEGRPPTTLHEWLGEGVEKPDAEQLALATCSKLLESLQAIELAPSGEDARSLIVQRFSKEMERDIVLFERLPGGVRGDPVNPVALNSWGHLEVRDASGATKTLMADYLF